MNALARPRYAVPMLGAAALLWRLLRPDRRGAQRPAVQTRRPPRKAPPPFADTEPGWYAG